VKRFDAYPYLLGADIHEERSDSMLIRTYLALITTKSEAIRCLTVPTWSQKFEEHLVGIIHPCSAFACDESTLDEKASKGTFVFPVIFVNSFFILGT
jgi:hypothetical protein